MFRPKAALLYALVAALLAACGQTPLADAPEEPGATLETAASSPYTYYQWYEGGPDTTTLIGADQGFCWLSGVQGGQSLISRAIVYKNKHSGRWEFDVAWQKWASATCIEWSALKIANNAFQPARMISDGFRSVGGWRGGSTKTWWGDAATYISGVSGNLNFRGAVDITQSRSGLGESSSLFSTNLDYTAYGYAHSMFFGKPQTNDVPQFWGPKAQGKTIDLAGEYWVGSSNPSVDMAPAAKAFCYLSSVSGSFDDAHDWVWLYRARNSAGEEVWRLNVHNSGHLAPDGDISAAATCYLLTQN